MPEEHALLGASSSKRWLHCTPSVRLEEGFPNESSVFAAEGTFAHEVCEYKVRKYLHERVKRPQSEKFYTEEIDQITDVYAEFVITIIEEMKRNGCEPLVLVEKRVDYSHIAPSGFGTADMIVIGSGADGKGLLHICDFKTGKGVFVDCDHNSQMMLYALGALHEYGYIYSIETVRMSIIQQRLDNVSTFECSRGELEAWGESIKPIARMYDRFVVPGFGKKQIKTLKRTDVRTFYNSLVDDGKLAINTLEVVHNFLHQIIDLAVNDDYIRYNPAHGALKELKREYENAGLIPEKRALTHKEQIRFTEYLRTSEEYARWYAPFCVLLHTGLRVGELCALQWSDVDFENRTITVSHTMVDYPDRTGEGTTMRYSALVSAQSPCPQVS